MKRRAFLTVTGGAFLAAPLAVKAQQAGKVWRLGFLALQERPTPPDIAFYTAMKELGYIQDQNLITERRYATGKPPEELVPVVRELVGLKVDVIFAWTAPWTLAAQRATSTIPIVFAGVRAPVERGIVPSLARPGGNVTGISTYAVDVIDPKLFEVAKQLIPDLVRVAVLSSSVDPPGATGARERAAQAVGVKVVPIPFSDEKDLRNIPAAIDRSNVQLLIAPDTPLLYIRRTEIVRYAERRRLPVVYAFREAVEEGGLVALSTDFRESARRAAIYVDKILNGAKPGDLPVEQPTKLDLSINMKTAKALGLTIPQLLLLRADQIIQ